MYERMLDKGIIPTEQEMYNIIGMESVKRMNQFEQALCERYTLTKELKFPFGNNYGWGYKYNYKSKHICYIFFEHGAFTVFLQIGDTCVASIESRLEQLSDKAKRIWSNRYPCEQGGWINYRILSDEDIPEAIAFIEVKVKPSVKK